MSSKKHTEILPELIEQYLNEVKKLIGIGKYTIALNENRRENVDFIEDYHITGKKEREILSGLKLEDFCYIVDNRKPGFTHEKLYVFCKQFQLDHWGTVENIWIYIKLHLTRLKDDNFIIVISFHKLNKQISFPFKG